MGDTPTGIEFSFLSLFNTRQKAFRVNKLCPNYNKIRVFSEDTRQGWFFSFYFQIENANLDRDLELNVKLCCFDEFFLLLLCLTKPIRWGM